MKDAEIRRLKLELGMWISFTFGFLFVFALTLIVPTNWPEEFMVGWQVILIFLTGIVAVQGWRWAVDLGKSIKEKETKSA